MPSSPRIRWLVTAIVLAAVGGGVAWIQVQARHAKGQASARSARRTGSPIPVRTALVADEEVAVVIGAPAVTAPSAKVALEIGPARRLNNVNPVITAVHVRNGDYVEAGELLIELDPADFERALIQAQKTMETARAQLARAESAIDQNAQTRQVEARAAQSELEFRKVDVDFRREDHDRLERLRKDGNASLHEYLEAAAAYAEARFRVTTALLRDRMAQAALVLGPLDDQRASAAAAEAVARATAEFELARGDLQRCQLRSPLSGLVDKIGVAKGQMVDTSTALAEVLQVDPIHLEVDFPQERMAEVATDQAVEVVLDAFKQETFEGRVVGISAVVDAQRRVVPVIVEVANPGHRIRVGISGYARLRLSRQATTVPAVAVNRRDEAAMAWVVQNGRAAARSVRAGQVVDTGTVEVIEGLAPGEEVVIFGQQFLEDDDPVNTDWRKWARRD